MIKCESTAAATAVANESKIPANIMVSPPFHIKFIHSTTTPPLRDERWCGFVDMYIFIIVIEECLVKVCQRSLPMLHSRYPYSCGLVCLHTGWLKSPFGTEESLYQKIKKQKLKLLRLAPTALSAQRVTLLNVI